MKVSPAGRSLASGQNCKGAVRSVPPVANSGHSLMGFRPGLSHRAVRRCTYVEGIAERSCCDDGDVSFTVTVTTTTTIAAAAAAAAAVFILP